MSRRVSGSDGSGASRQCRNAGMASATAASAATAAVIHARRPRRVVAVADDAVSKAPASASLTSRICAMRFLDPSLSRARSSGARPTRSCAVARSYPCRARARARASSVTSSSRESGPPRQHLVEQAAKSPDVGALVDRFTACLLGAHVSRRAEQDASLGHRRRRQRCRLRPADRSGVRAPWRSRSRAP